MSELYIKNIKNASSIPTVHWKGTPSKPATPALAYKGGGQISYLPLITKTGSWTNAAGTRKFSYDASAMSTIHCRYNGTEYVVPNKVVDIVTVEITAVSTSSEKIGSGTSGYYKKTVKVSYKATGNSGYAKLSCSVINSEGLAYSTTTSGQTQINAGSSGTVSYTVTAIGGSSSATVVVKISVTSSSGNSRSTTATLSSPWSWVDSSSSGGSSEP